MTVDSQGVYFVLRQYGSMLQDALRKSPPVIEYRNVRRVVVCGMGGSGVVGEFVAALVDRVSVHTIKGYTLPAWVGHDDLVVCVSYSGNTEETIDCFRQAVRRGSLLLVITSGGKLLSLARDGGFAHVVVPSGLPPRFATIPMLVPVFAVLQELGVSEEYAHLPGNVFVDEESCKYLAQQLVGHTPLVYASTRNRVLAEKLKTDINENAKIPAFFNVFPEANHNELNSYEHITPRYVVVFIEDSHDHPRVRDRFAVVAKILEDRGVSVLRLPVSGETRASVLLQGNLAVLFTSYFLALAYGIDPGPVSLIEEFKQAITQKE